MKVSAISLFQSILNKALVVISVGKLTEDPVGGEPGKFFQAEISTMARPGITLRARDHAGPNGVEMNVAHQFEQIVVRINQQSLVAPLEKMAGLFLPPVEILRIAKAEILHDSGKRNFLDLNGKMDVIAHQA